MKRKLLWSILLIGSSCLLMRCECRKNIFSPQEQLPPATQTGANTFGCYVNGKLWVPKGYNGISNLVLSYDPRYKGGAFNLITYRIAENKTQYILIGADSISKTGIYSLSIDDKGHKSVNFIETITPCTYDTASYINGAFVIAKFDLQHQIISGTFEFTLAKPGCDTIRVTNGRFDMKL